MASPEENKETWFDRGEANRSGVAPSVSKLSDTIIQRLAGLGVYLNGKGRFLRD